jgi:arabinofuranosyltransferase
MSTRKLYSPLLSVLILTLLLAVYNRFIQDDAFISFRYAKNLAAGNGLVFNIGERVEGYTNFLWTLLMAPAFLVKADPVYFSWTLGLILFPGSIYLTYRIGTALSRKKTVGLLAALLTGTNYTYSSYATGGLETQAQSFAFLAITFLLIKIREQATFTRLFLFSISTAATFLIRMDSAILIAPAFLVLLITLVKSEKDWPLSRLAVATCPAMVIASLWLIWKLFYYGNVLPNTFYIKASAHSLVPGFYYICLFFFSYGLFLIFPAMAYLLLKNKPHSDKNTGFVLAALLLWLLYIVKIGGGFMEFRLMVPVVPFIFIFIAWTICRAFSRASARTAWVLLFCGISLFHSQRNRLYGVETIRGLENHVRAERWIDAGQSLNKYFSGTDIVISTTAAGALPFYSGLTTIDMLGLNDKWIAVNGVPTQSSSRRWLGEKPGHQKKAPMDYLISRNVNLLIGHPQVISPASKTYTRSDFVGDAFYQLDQPPPQTTKVLEIPVDDQAVLIALYIRKHPAVETVIHEMNWRVYPLH